MADQDPSRRPRPGLPRVLAAFLTLVFAVVLVRTAWLSDDAAITLRTVLNVTHGFGLTYNVVERVQTFTHPLWLALLTAVYVITRHLYVTVFGLSIALSLYAFWRAVSTARSATQAFAAAVVLTCSNAFVDFSTSGLEAPLAFVLLLLLLAVFRDEETDRRTWLTRLWLIASCLYLTRPDAVLFALPFVAMACVTVRSPAAHARAAIVGTLPAAAWTIFALVYYGFPFPNTAYAKLAMGIARGDLWMQGVLYLVDSIDRDPITLSAIGLAMLLGFSTRSTAARAAAVGLGLYLIYIVSIGGDFMTGRFLAAPVFLAVLVASQLATPSKAVWIPSTIVLALIASAASHVPLWSDSAFGDRGPKPSGIVNERAVYFREKSLVLAKRGTFRDLQWPRARRTIGRLQVLETCGLMGTAGLEYGPYAYLLDTCGLADPLMARMPSLFNPEWRAGHYRRAVPAGYRESVEQSANLIQDPKLHEYYEHVRVVTRATPLLSAARLRAVVAMNTRAYDGLIDQSFYRHGGSVVALADLSTVRAAETPWDAPGNRVFTVPLAVLCPDKPGRRYLDVALDSDDRYLLTFLKGPAMVGTADLGPIPEWRRRPGLTNYTIDVPPRAAAEGFDAVVISPISGNDRYAVGHVLLEGFGPTDAELYRRVSLRDGITRR